MHPSTRLLCIHIHTHIYIFVFYTTQLLTIIAFKNIEYFVAKKQGFLRGKKVRCSIKLLSTDRFLSCLTFLTFTNVLQITSKKNNVLNWGPEIKYKYKITQNSAVQYNLQLIKNFIVNILGKVTISNRCHLLQVKSLNWATMPENHFIKHTGTRACHIEDLTIYTTDNEIWTDFFPLGLRKTNNAVERLLHYNNSFNASFIHLLILKMLALYCMCSTYFL